MGKGTTHAINPGDRFGRGTVLEEIRIPVARADRTSVRGARLICDPELGGCGTVYEAELADLRRKKGSTRSCGCLRREGNHTTHGLSRHGGQTESLYRTWTHMMDRCHKPEDPSFGRYGGRGIEVCPEWHDVRVFVAWVEANLGPRPEGCSLDRWPDNNGPYAPANVRWADDFQQARNSRAYLDGRCEHPMYNAWWGIRSSRAGLHGSWRDFQVFVSDIEAELGPRPAGLRLRRVDLNGIFAPGNVFWGQPSGRPQRH